MRVAGAVFFESSCGMSIFVPMLSSIYCLILAGVFQSVEFYVIAVTVAAMIVALCNGRGAPGPVREVLLAGVISREHERGDDEASRPEIELICCDDGQVILRRHGLAGVTASGAVSLAIEIKGFEVKIKERIVDGLPGDEPVDTASFILDFMAPERYFIMYKSELPTGAVTVAASLSLSNRSGNRVVKPLV